MNSNVKDDVGVSSSRVVTSSPVFSRMITRKGLTILVVLFLMAFAYYYFVIRPRNARHNSHRVENTSVSHLAFTHDNNSRSDTDDVDNNKTLPSQPSEVASTESDSVVSGEHRRGGDVKDDKEKDSNSAVDRHQTDSNSEDNGGGHAEQSTLPREQGEPNAEHDIEENDDAGKGGAEEEDDEDEEGEHEYDN